MRYVSIAKDFYYETSASTLSYYITCNGRTVYSGVSVKPSDSPVNRISIRKRIADYLEIDMPDFRDYDGVVIPHPEQLRDFELYSSDGTLLETYRALLGYYDEWDGSDVVQSDPVNGHTDPRQKIFWGIISSAPQSVPSNTEGGDYPRFFTPALTTYVCTGSEQSMVWQFETNYDVNEELFFYTDSTEVYVFSTHIDNIAQDHIDFTIYNEAERQETAYIIAKRKKDYVEVGRIEITNAPSTAITEGGYFSIQHIPLSADPESSVVSFENVMTGHTITLSYSINGYKWKEITVPTATDYHNPERRQYGQETVPISQGDTIYVKSNRYRGNLEGGWLGEGLLINFYSPGIRYNYKSIVKGNIMSLVYGDDFKEKYAFPQDTGKDVFGDLFRGYIVDASELLLPATALTEGCYAGLFSSSGTATAPSVYSRKILGIPSLPATQLAKSCYAHMFFCSELKCSPPALPATVLAKHCYSQMFSGSDIVSAPVLPAPALPTDILFGEGAYNEMFRNCHNLSSIECYVTDDDTAIPGNALLWTEDVAAEGTFTKKRGTNWPTGENGIPDGWTVIEID